MLKHFTTNSSDILTVPMVIVKIQIHLSPAMCKWHDSPFKSNQDCRHIFADMPTWEDPRADRRPNDRLIPRQGSLQRPNITRTWPCRSPYNQGHVSRLLAFHWKKNSHDYYTANRLCNKHQKYLVYDIYMEQLLMVNNNIQFLSCCD